MTTATLPAPRFPTIGEVQTRLGDVPVHRILSLPAPGTATANDLLDPHITRGKGVELVDGILVRKPMGFREDYIAILLICEIGRYLDEHNIGAICGSQGLIRFMPNLVRLPDVTFTRWDSADDPADIEDPDTAFLDVTPDLVVEVLSESNTPREMQIKLGEYAAAGVKLVWYIDPDAKTVTVYPKGRERGKKVLGEGDTLDGGKVLPGFALPVADLFAPRAPKTTKKRKK
ncbi:MAG: Uma2 family endonuclease [Fimbriiglobus sp.]|jgi:Uma2 family endonuclease|nr:Uma2 family endonuclease [Fimbriiglobus sp.]